jgi:hypothetical protein
VTQLFASLERILSFRRVPMRAVVLTAFLSYLFQLGAIIQGLPLYLIVLYTLLPWVPLLMFEGIWKYEHYNALAFFGLITMLQAGHLGEHFVQIAELSFLGGTLACPPPVDDLANHARAIQQGLAAAGSAATGLSAVTVINPDTGVAGPPACGVFGQLDFETVHLVWDTLVWFGALFLITRFPRNRWLWVSVIAASLHETEHLFLGWTYFTDTVKSFTITAPLWATVANGSIVTAHPVGTVQQAVDFYGAGGWAGIMGKKGMLEAVLGTEGIMPLRPYLHFFYNSVVVIPTVIAFFMQVRTAYDVYLARALPQLTEQQLSLATPKLVERKYDAGEAIVIQGDVADRFYIITAGQVEVLYSMDGAEPVTVATLSRGQYFGEIGLLQGGKRVATVRAKTDVTVLSLDRETFAMLMSASERERVELDQVTLKRLAELGQAPTS